MCSVTLLGQTAEPSLSLPLMPWPAEVHTEAASVAITTDFTVSLAGDGAADPRVADSVDRLFTQIARQTGIPIRPHVVAPGSAATLRIVVERRDHALPQRLEDDERYALNVSATGVTLSADAPLGVIRGLETFLQLIEQANGSPGFSVPGVAIRDEPRFAWRGFSLDVSRHFIPVDEVERTIDGMAAVKLNVLHWHLSDDQGFRVESRKFPRLQQYGSDGLYYTQAQIRDVIAFARNRGIRIVPEFDMPGHASSWLPGYPILGVGRGPFEISRGYGILSGLMDPTKESTYRFLDRFVGEMAGLFPDAYFHIGGDEVAPKAWNESASIQAFMKKHHLENPAALQAYFNGRMLKILTKHHKAMLGWDEIFEPDLPKNIVIEAWRNDKPLAAAAQQGFRGILSAGYYLDLMYPASRHYTVDPLTGSASQLTPEEKKQILGGEAAMWEELATPENLDAKLWPRLAAIAERFWSPESVTDTSSMYRRLEIANRWLEWLGLTQRSALELMRQRLAGDMPYEPLDRFASILEPVKGYSRHAQRYLTSTPLNRLVDAIPPESKEGREFSQAVDKYLAAPGDQPSADALSIQLKQWQENVAAVRPIFQSNSLLTENLAAADAIEALCKAGQEALGFLSSKSNPPAPADWKQRNVAAVQDAAQRKGDVLIAIAPAIQKLVEAVR